MSQQTRHEVLTKLRRHYRRAGRAYKIQLLDQAQALFGYHRIAAIRALRAKPVEPGARVCTGHPLTYGPARPLPWLKPIWQATDYACGRRLQAMLPEWIPACEQHERRLPTEAKEKLLLASARTTPTSSRRTGPMSVRTSAMNATTIRRWCR